MNARTGTVSAPPAAPAAAARAPGGGYLTALRVELLKARRSAVPAATMGALAVVAAMAALFMFVAADPDRARRFGLLSQKAELSGLTADWSGLMSFLSQASAIGFLLVFAFIPTWVFGREFAEGTVRSLLALPVRRSTVVLAKFTVTALWALVAVGWLTGLILAIGWLMRLPGGTTDVLRTGVGHAAAAGGLAFVSTTPVAMVACVGRGYLPPLAAAAAGVIVAQVSAVLGWGALVPWSVPAVAAGLTPGTSLGPVGLFVTAATGAAGVLGTLYWWREHAGT